ncbi:MAG TPA: hypothetical protein VIM42_12450 [Clostridium sp.]
MDEESFYELTAELSILTGLEDIGYHKLLEDRLQPVMKSNKGKITQEDWIRHHMDNPVLLANNSILIELLSTNKKVCIKDASITSSADMDPFTVRSVYMFPLIVDENVIGVLPIVSIGVATILENATLIECEKIILKYKNIF